jgi:EpsI family protein
MKKEVKPFAIFGALLIAAIFAMALKPTEFLADQFKRVDLEAMVPKHLNGWEALPGAQTQIVDPGQLALINRLYTQTLNRGYVNSQGYVVMLSIAYGKDQRDALQVHKPEVCYPAQGFTLLDKRQYGLETGLKSAKKIKVTHLQTALGARIEPVTYWTLIGEKVYSGNLDKKLAEMQYGLEGKIPDGMLVRMSSIDSDSENAFKMQSQFAIAMLASLQPEVRARFSGRTFE